MKKKKRRKDSMPTNSQLSVAMVPSLSFSHALALVLMLGSCRDQSLNGSYLCKVDTHQIPLTDASRHPVKPAPVWLGFDSFSALLQFLQC